RQLAVPAYFEAARVGEVFRVDYQGLAAQAVADAAEHGITMSSSDQRRTCLVVIDAQNTFCVPGFELYVPGAVADTERLVRFLYRYLPYITEITLTLDTHMAMQIFHAQFWVGRDGAHPAPHTDITTADVASGLWRVNPAVARSLGRTTAFLERYVQHYVQSLEQEGKFALTIWPYHAMLGGIGHALVASLEEAVFYHGIARSARPDFAVKGSHPLTENYSALRPEVMVGPDGADIGAQRNTPFLEKLLQFDHVIIAGQAKSHCVAWTVGDLLAEIQTVDPRLARKVYLLEDCTSPVTVPGVVDFSKDADQAFRRFAEAGMHLVRSDQPLDTWPGLKLG
ncbi:MAG: hypothetical protein JWN15_3496, partial [Firmicutes bacterium]|nr:hypothetical protein [Bacillota bacterium]